MPNSSYGRGANVPGFSATTALVTLASGIVSGVVVAYFNYYFQRSREEFNLPRSKGEALLVKIKEMGDFIKKINMNIKRAIYSGNGEGLPHERFLELYGP